MEVVNKALAFRKEQEKEWGGNHHECGCKHATAKKLGDVTTINLTLLKAGTPTTELANSSAGGANTLDGREYSINVIPTEAEVTTAHRHYCAVSHNHYTTTILLLRHCHTTTTTPPLPSLPSHCHHTMQQHQQTIAPPSHHQHTHHPRARPT